MRPLERTDLELHGYSKQTIKKLQAAKLGGKQPLAAGRPAPPDDLNTDELVVWNATAALLEERGTLTPGDGPLLTLYATTVVEHRTDRALLEREGRVHIVSRLDKNSHEIVIHAVNPRCRVVRGQEAQLISLMRELGLTPLRRGHVAAAHDPEADKPVKQRTAMDDLNDELDRIGRTN
jgi:P27 family predicted phage terminase small subunit